MIKVKCHAKLLHQNAESNDKIQQEFSSMQIDTIVDQKESEFK